MDLPTVEGGFGCILADPPWRFNSYDGKDHVPTSARAGTRHADRYYKTTLTNEMAEIPVASVTAKDCALFMWITDTHFERAIGLAKSWGFEYKTCAFVWVKTKRGGWPTIGMGFWTRKQTEQCWIFTKGSPRRLNKGVEQIIFCKRGQHSAKPDEQYGRIEALVSGPYLELFARSKRPGWSSWGNQVGARDAPLFPEIAA